MYLCADEYRQKDKKERCGLNIINHIHNSIHNVKCTSLYCLAEICVYSIHMKRYFELNLMYTVLAHLKSY